MVMDDDSVYTAKVQLGNTDAFGVLYDRYLDKIYRFIYYKTFSKEVAEDLTSDVFHKALTKIGSFDNEKGNFSAWLYRIARNSVIDHYRTKKNDVPIDDTFDVGVDERTPETLDAIAELGHVTKYLETLNAKQREIIMLRVWEEKSYREIAEIVGGTEDAVKMAYSRSIRDLREKCGQVSFGAIFLACGLAKTLLFHDFS
jgi:RNA polymerase sigma-70 factor, ECF subfamily